MDCYLQTGLRKRYILSRIQIVVESETDYNFMILTIAGAGLDEKF